MSSATITLVTGINRSGKTLWLLPHVEKLRKEENRPVYYFGIPGIKEAGILTEWIEIAPFDKDDPTKRKLSDTQQLHELPQGAIIVIDEAHRTFPNRPQKNEPPPGVQNFDMAGHRGHSFFLVTQVAKDIDLFIRGRVGKHVHMIRTWGLERATRLEFDTLAESPEKMKKTSFAHEFKYPKEVYGWYKSSDLHTIKKTVPWSKLHIFFWGPPLVVGMIWYAVHRINQHRDSGAATKPGAAVEHDQKAKTFEEVRNAALRRPYEQAPDWASRFVERVKGVPQSEAFYDAAYKAATVPRAAGFIVLGRDGQDTCTALTQQGTKITTLTNEQCLYLFRNGDFDPMKPDDETPGKTAKGGQQAEPSQGVGHGLLGQGNPAS